jgi:hypothetical protein
LVFVRLAQRLESKAVERKLRQGNWEQRIIWDVGQHILEE